MAHWAKPGVKCVCVFDGALPESMPLKSWHWTPTKGHIYTIVSVEQHAHGVGLTLKECATGNHQIFSVRRFRPLVTKTQEQDVALFQHMLDGQPIGEDA